MQKIAHVKEAALLANHLPQEVVQAVTQIAAVLDNEYVAHRHPDADRGGYNLVLEKARIRKYVRSGGENAVMISSQGPISLLSTQK